MEKDTLRGKVKILSYFIAFIFMVGIKLTIQKNDVGNISANNMEIRKAMATTRDTIVKINYRTIDSLSVSYWRDK